MKAIIDEFAIARGQVFRSASEVEDIKAEAGDLQRQFDEALHEISELRSEVLPRVFPIFNEFYLSFFFER